MMHPLNELIIESFDPNTASEQIWEAYFHYSEKGYFEERLGDPPPPRELVRRDLLTHFPGYESKRWLVFKDESRTSVIASLILGYSVQDDPAYELNKNLAWPRIFVDRNYRRTGIGRQLLSLLIEEVRKINRSSLEAFASIPDGIDTCRHLGGLDAICSSENRLDMDHVDWEMVEQWVVQGTQNNPETKIIQCSAVPEDLIADFCNVLTECSQTSPHGELESRDVYTTELRRTWEQKDAERGKERITLFTLEPDGHISSITEMTYIPEMPDRLFQEWTGVKVSDRQRGLGKWLKAQMLLRVRQRYPNVQIVITGNADNNESMLSINRRLGFKTFRSGITFKFDVQELSKQL